MWDRLATMDRVAKWSLGVDTTCVLCKSAVETRNHLFFECSFSLQLWRHLTLGILGNSHSNTWSALVPVLSGRFMEKKRLFCVRYSFQAAIYALWRERNKIKHGEKPMTIETMKKLVDKGIRNKLRILRMQRRKGMEGALQFWLETRV